MPYGGPYFTEYEIQKIERWIADGAKNPNGEETPAWRIQAVPVCVRKGAAAVLEAGVAAVASNANS
ncbi:MAG TPA: hypothetical protein ACFYEH_09710 [Candidatus Brocadiaceae bacterium]